MHTIAEIARETGVTPKTIHRWVVSLGLKSLVTGRTIILSDESKAAILANLKKKPGNPGFIPGNEIGKLGGRPKKKKD